MAVPTDGDWPLADIVSLECGVKVPSLKTL
jgi:hypothetical protein